MAELPLTVQLVSVVVPATLNRPPPSSGGVAADGAVGQRGGGAKVLYTPPPPPVAELLLTVQLVSVSVPPEVSMPPPLPSGYAGGVAADGAVGQRGSMP